MVLRIRRASDIFSDDGLLLMAGDDAGRYNLIEMHVTILRRIDAVYAS